MSKAYLILIGLLALIAASIGAFAYYRSTTPSPTAPATSQVPTTSPTTPSQTTTPEVVPETAASQISLTVTSPTDGQEVSAATITVKGQTVANADVAVNDKDLKADASGNFQTTLTLDEGDNDIFITASDQTGNFSDWEGTVTYTSSQ